MNINDFVADYGVVKSDNGCWLWTLAKTDRGYGRVTINCKTRRAHRVAYALVNGEIPDGLHICHRCDTPSCVNPDHLYAGTALDNMRDMIKKGRKRVRRGMGHHAARLTEEQVSAIRQDPRSHRLIGETYGIHRNYVFEIKHRLSRSSPG